MQTNLQPVAGNDRIWMMDALRGLAILGIYLMNLPSFTYYFGAVKSGPFFTAADGTLEFIERMLMEGKFYSIFSFLFGWGIALQLGRLQARGIGAVGLVRRRLAILFLLGMAHLLLLWMGDIVAFYALLGFVLLWLRKASDKALLITAVAFLLAPVLLYALRMQFPLLAQPAEWLRQQGFALDGQLNRIQSDEQFFHLIHTMDYWQSLKLNIVGVLLRYADLLFQDRAFKVLGMFLVGYVMGRSDRYPALMNHPGLLWRIAIAGLLIGLPANAVMETFSEQAYYAYQPAGLYKTIAYALGVAPLALAYIALFFLAARTTRGSALLKYLAPPGRMAFTNYIMHSVIGLFLFTGVGLGWDRQVGVVWYTLFGLLVFGLQIWLSTLWLKHFHYGPVEWLWRSSTYGKRQQMKKGSKAAEERPASVAS